MVRSLSQWTKTLSFPARISPNRNSKECNINVHSVTPPSQSVNQSTPQQHPSHPPPPPPPPPKKYQSSSSPTNIPITEISQIIYPDPDSEAAIMGSVVFCIHHKQGCKWTDELRKLKAHLNACKHDAILCPNKCGSQIPRVMMTDHLQFTCTQRRTRCEYCNVEFSGQGLEDHTGTCSQEPIYCEKKCGVRILRGRMSMHCIKDCMKRLRRCVHCGREFSADTLHAHMATCPRGPIVCPQRCETGTAIPRSEMEAHLRDDCKALSIPCTFKDAGCRFKGPRHLLETHLEANTTSHLSLMVTLSARQNQQIQMLKSAVSKLSTNYTGTLLWKITDWTDKMSDAKSKDGLELVSPPFYTSQYGYKLQASMFLNGNGPGEGTHISVYIKVLPGEYDALLKWPFSHSITFTLFEQGNYITNNNINNNNNNNNSNSNINNNISNNNSNSIGSVNGSGGQRINNSSSCSSVGSSNYGGPGGVAESFVPDPSWSNFQRPSQEPDSLGFGFPKFISHELLGRRPFVKDDTVFLRVKVDPSKIVAV